jgi:hypothetical protein
MYFKGKILTEEPGCKQCERLCMVEADNIKEAYAKLIHTCRLMAAGVAPSFEDDKAIFRHGKASYTLQEITRTTKEGFLIEHLVISREWWGELEYAEEALAACAAAGKVTT